MPLSFDQIRSIRNTWRYFKQIDASIFGNAFFTKLFTDQPSLKNAFGGEMAVYYKKLHDFLNIAVARIDQIDTVVSANHNQIDLGHTGQLLDQYYCAFEAALIWTLQKGMGPEWTDASEEAWKRYYHLLINKIGKISTVAESIRKHSY